MQPKTLKTAYWIATGLFALLLVMDGLGGVMRAEAGVEALQHLGYPLYLLPMTGVAKILAAVAILQNRFRVIKEWAFAGFAISCYGAFWSRAAVGDGVELLAFPVAFFLIMLVPYILWKTRENAASGLQPGPAA